jgi:hypothetical protein
MREMTRSVSGPRSARSRRAELSSLDTVLLQFEVQRLVINLEALSVRGACRARAATTVGFVSPRGTHSSIIGREADLRRGDRRGRVIDGLAVMLQVERMVRDTTAKKGTQ